MKKENRMELTAVFAALVVNFLIQQEATSKVSFFSFLLVAAFAFAFGIYADVREFKKSDKMLLYKGIALTFGVLLLVQLVGLYGRTFAGNIHVLTKWTAILAMIVGYLIFMFVFLNEQDMQDVVFLIFMAAVSIRVFYVALMPVRYMQDALGVFSPNQGGHLGYIYHIYATGLLPEGDPGAYGQFWQPPLYYIISALWLRLTRFTGLGLGQLTEHLQALSLLFGSLTLAYMDKIAYKLNLSEYGRILTLGLAGFMPFSIIMAGSVGNDALMLLLCIMAVYYVLDWWEKPCVRRMLKIAVSAGAAMMTKLSAWVVLPAILLVLVIKFIQNRKEWRSYLVQLPVFLMLTALLGLWWPVKNRILYGMPFTYGLQGAGTESVFARASAWDSLIKTAVFGNSDYYLRNGIVQRIGMVMYCLTLIILPLVLVTALVWLCTKGDSRGSFFKLTLPGRLLLLGIALLSGAVHIISCILQTQNRAEDIRSLIPAALVCFIGAGGFLGKVEDTKAGPVLIRISSGFVIIYMLLSVLLTFHMLVLFG